MRLLLFFAQSKDVAEEDFFLAGLFRSASRCSFKSCSLFCFCKAIRCCCKERLGMSPAMQCQASVKTRGVVRVYGPEGTRPPIFGRNRAKDMVRPSLFWRIWAHFLDIDIGHPTFKIVPTPLKTVNQGLKHPRVRFDCLKKLIKNNDTYMVHQSNLNKSNVQISVSR